MSVRTFLIICVLLTIIVFLVGGAATFVGYVNTSSYALLTGVFGSIASILGLISLSSKKLTSSDIREVETDLLAALASTSRELNEYEDKLARNIEEVNKTELQKAEIEPLVRKAGAKIFMEERLRRASEEIDNFVSENRELTELVQGYASYKNTVKQLDGEVKQSPNAELIMSIVDEVMSQKRRFYVDFMGTRIEISPFVNALDVAASAIARAIVR